MANFGFRLTRRGAVSLDQWFFKSLPMVGLWQGRLTTEGAESTRSCCFICALCDFPDPFLTMIKNHLNQVGHDPAKSREKFEQAFMRAFGWTGNGSAKPPGRLQQTLQRMLSWRNRIG